MRALKSTIVGLAAILIVGVLTPLASAHTVTMESIDAGWANLYASEHRASVVKVPVANSAHVEKQSEFKINYTDVPENEKPAIEAALNVWSQNWKSSVPVTIDASYSRQASTSVLALATPVKYFRNFPGAPSSDLYYPSAMANAIAGKDLDPQNPEISIQINSVMSSSFYLGTDGNCPTDSYDLESIILHEMGHGLGFLSNDSYDPAFGFGSIDQPTPFDAYAQLPDGRRLMDIDSPSLELGTALVNTLVWAGKNGIAANNGVKPLLYTPNPYEPGSSISHLDERSFSSTGENAVMTPNLAAGEVFHAPGSILLAMLQDMREKPPAGVATAAPNVPRNVKALVGDKSAIVTWNPPTNYRTAQVSSYTVKVNQSGLTQSTDSTSLTIPNLKNGQSYSFTVTATNVIGTSAAATTNAVVPQSSWVKSTIDSTSDAKNLATTTFQGLPVVVYSDSVHGQIKLATYTGKKWNIQIIDGNGGSGGTGGPGGRTAHDVSGYVSLCTSGVGKKQVLNIFYADLTDKDLRYASYDGKKWNFDIVDGNGAKIQDFKEIARVRTASDVSVSSACVSTPDGLQVFYRDDSQGVLLGAVRSGKSWRYEEVDGDRATDGRTTGDVAFHLKATAIGKAVYLLYDSPLKVNSDHLPIQGEIREATRSSAYPEDWVYSTPDPTGKNVTIAGFDVSMSTLGTSISAAWLGSGGLTIPAADQVRWTTLGATTDPISAATDNYGVPTAPIAFNGRRILFGCGTRLCVINTSDRQISLVSTSDFTSIQSVQWIVINKITYALVGADGKLSLFKAI